VEAPAAAIGARILFTFVGDFNLVMEITRLDPDRELGWRSVGGHDTWADDVFRFGLADLDDGHTSLRFWQEYATGLDDAYGPYNFNWGYYLESLRLYCSTGTGKPFQPPA
jgi:hypothetical protein